MRNVRRHPELERWDFEFLTTLKGTPWNPNPPAGEMAVDALQTWQFRCQHQHQHQFLRSWWQLHRWIVQRAERASRKVDVQKFGFSMNFLGCRSVMTKTTARAHTEEYRKRLESLAEDEETKLRSETELRVDIWLVELNRLRNRGVVPLCQTSRVERRSAPAAAASDLVPMVVSSSSADERFRSDEVPDHGLKRLRWSPHGENTTEFYPNESSV